MAGTMNEMDVDAAERRGVPGSRLLWAYKNMINANSDGWAYWHTGRRASEKLQALVQRTVDAQYNRASFVDPLKVVPVTSAEIAKALVPMKSLCTRRDLPKDWAQIDDPGMPVKR